MKICDQLEKNQRKMATYMAELSVLNYSIHVITSVYAGSALVQEDHIRSSFLLDNQNSHYTVTASAGITFLNIVNVNIETDYTSQTTLTKSYQSNGMNSRFQSFGGVLFYPGITLETWQKGITNHLVAIDYAGFPLHFFIKPDKLPGLLSPLVKKLSKTVETAMRHYYIFNTDTDCTNTDSPTSIFKTIWTMFH